MVKDCRITNSIDVDINDATPMLRQFLEIKKQNQGVILLYRMGDFYETFLEDAVIASKELEITLTSREAGKLGRIPMAGVPVKAVDGYIAKLLEKNYKIAICEQTEDPALAKGLVERKVVRTITAGTITETNLLESTKNNYLAAIIKSEKKELFGFAYVDISTGEFKITELALGPLLSELGRIAPSEVVAPVKKQKIMPFQIVPDEIINLPKEIREKYNCSKVGNSSFDEKNAVEKIKKAFGVLSIESFGYPEFACGIMSAGAIIDYLEETQKESIPKFDVIVPYRLDSYVSIDANTRKNLELTETARDGNYKGSLLWAVNKTCTNMGTRLLRKWIQQPLQDIEQILKRQNGVEELLQNSHIRQELSCLLDRVYDIERLATKISNNSANARDFLAIKDSLALLPDFKEFLKSTKSQYLKVVAEEKNDLEDFCKLMEKTVHENPPVGVKEGNLIKNGVNDELDYLKGLLTGGQEWLEIFENREKEKTGIKSLKVGYSKTFGFFIEVTHANTNLVPASYMRRQTLTNAERYITEELKIHETEVLSAQAKSIELEYKIFSDFREYSKEFVKPLRELAEAFSVLDVLLSFAKTAVEQNYTKPEIDRSNNLIIIEGRHPVVELLLPMGQYVANDLNIKGGDVTNPEETEFMILTGPNMAGKSTYMRQNALIVILAQIGSFVPAREAKIGVVDKIFTRVGSVDDLSMGQSTFMVEMTETALILNSATDRSFILLDEIGRGTSTYDGVAIAWAVVEYIFEKINARTIFATHYHELNIMCDVYPQIKNYKITVSENDGEIEFLRKVVPGGTSRSYGIQVAKMAGLPQAVIARSENLMARMQKDYTAKTPSKKRSKDEIKVNTPQLTLFVE
jgi:DNA mismatch repair protein MutS